MRPMTTKQGNIFVKFQVNQKQFQTRVAAALLTVAGDVLRGAGDICASEPTGDERC